MKIENAAIDTDVELYLNSNGTHSSVPTSLVHIGTIVALLGGGTDEAIIAWKDKASATTNAVDMAVVKSMLPIVKISIVLGVQWDISNNIDDYNFAVRLHYGAEVGIPVPPTLRSGILSPDDHPTLRLKAVKPVLCCSRCNSPNEYAEVEEGKVYTCYGCKH